MTKNLADYYYDFRSAGAFMGIKPLQRVSGQPYNKVKKWLQSQRTYTLHHPVIRKFKRNRTIAYDIDEVWQSDLIDLQKHQSYNNGYTFILTAIDILSKHAFVEPLKNKKPESVIAAFRKIFSETNRKPKLLHTDKGQEYLAHSIQNFFRTEGIKHYVTQSENKGSVIERFNKSLKLKLFRVFTYRGNYKYVDVLQDLVHGYNNNYHRSIKRTPISVKTKKDAKQVFKTLYPEIKNKKKPKFKINDTVRISMTKHAFTRSFKEGNWSDEVFTIHSVHTDGDVPTYRLKSYDGLVLTGRFYEKELQLIDNTAEIYAVDRIIKRRKRKGKPAELLVTWRGYPESHQTWIREDDIKPI